MRGEAAAEQPVVIKAEVQAKIDQTLAKLAEFIPQLKDLKVEQYHGASTRFSGEPALSVSVFISNRTEGKFHKDDKHISAHLEFSSTGQLISFNLRNPQWASKELPSEELAQERAQAFVQHILGDKSKQYKMLGVNGHISGASRSDDGKETIWRSSSVGFNRLVNGVPYINSQMRVDVDSGGNVVSFSRFRDLEVDESKFPDPGLAVDMEKVKADFAQSINMNLRYINKIEKGPLSMKEADMPGKPILTYIASNYDLVNAVTGQPWTEQKNQQGTEDYLKKHSLVGQGKSAIVKSYEDAANFLERELGLDLTGLKKPDFDRSPIPIDSKAKIIHYSWHTEPVMDQDGNFRPSESKHIGLEVEADTGRIIGLNVQDDSRRGIPVMIDQEAALKTATEFLSNYLPKGQRELFLANISSEIVVPDWVDKNKLDKRHLPEPQFSFFFNETYQDIPVLTRYYSVSVDGESGKILGFHLGEANQAQDLPDSKGVISQEVAKEAFLKHFALELAYVWPEYFDQKASEPMLIYMPKMGPYFSWIDAKTGEPVK